jgi:hypothetical protein
MPDEGLPQLGIYFVCMVRIPGTSKLQIPSAL